MITASLHRWSRAAPRPAGATRRGLCLRRVIRATRCSCLCSSSGTRMGGARSRWRSARRAGPAPCHATRLARRGSSRGSCRPTGRLISSRPRSAMTTTTTTNQRAGNQTAMLEAARRCSISQIRSRGSRRSTLRRSGSPRSGPTIPRSPPHCSRRGPRRSRVMCSDAPRSTTPSHSRKSSSSTRFWRAPAGTVFFLNL
jgi:hypothetical protein